MIWPRQKDTREENTKINYGMDSRGEKKKRTSKKNVDGRSTSSLDNKKFKTRSMEKQGGMAFGFWKTATAVIKADKLIASQNIRVFSKSQFSIFFGDICNFKFQKQPRYNMRLWKTNIKLLFLLKHPVDVTFSIESVSNLVFHQSFNQIIY
jgi:hypothetical protein